MVYFIQSSEQIKIGYSAEPASRLLRCKTWRPDGRLVLCLETPDDAKAEVELKTHFQNYHLGGEWFAINLQSAVQALLDLGLLAVGQRVLEMTDVPEVHPDFLEFLQSITRRLHLSEKEVKAEWCGQHVEFLKNVECMTVAQMVAEHETGLDEGLSLFREGTQKLREKHQTA